MSDFTMQWEGSVPSSDIVEKVRDELSDLMDSGLDHPSDLMFHHVKLTDDWDGPSVIVTGDEIGFLCEFHSGGAAMKIDPEIIGADLPDDERDALRAAVGLPPVGGSGS